MTLNRGAQSTKKGVVEGRKLRIGVTHFIRDGSQSIWENGIFQNCYFLLMLLKKSPIVERCFVVNGGPGSASDAVDFLKGTPAPVITMQDAMSELDVVIELSAQLDPKWAQEFKARGGTIIGMHVASDYVIDCERMAFALPPTLLMAGGPYDEIWTLHAFEKTCRAYYETGFRAPVKVMQHLWNSEIVDRSASDSGRVFAYQPGRTQWRLGVFEPNLCSVKTCHIPMLVSDLAYRKKSDAIEVMRVFNALQLKEHGGFVAFANSLDLVRCGKASFEGRYPIFEVLGVHCDAVISHHWENAQNYLYYETLHAGFPIVHNSDLLGGCGYRYVDYDPEDGSFALLQAFAEHDRNLSSYKRDAAEFLATLDPCADENVQSYTRAIDAIVERAHRS